jgi:hypothetical protein
MVTAYPIGRRGETSTASFRGVRQREPGIQTLSNFGKGWIPGSAFGGPGMTNTWYAAGQMAAMPAKW